MKIVVIGGTGLIGSKAVITLREHRHEAVAASPNSGVNTLTAQAGMGEANIVVTYVREGEFPEAYIAGELKDSHAKTIPGSNPVTGYSTTTHMDTCHGRFIRNR